MQKTPKGVSRSVSKYFIRKRTDSHAVRPAQSAADQRLAAHAVPVEPARSGSLSSAAGADDRRRQQEGEARRVLVGEADEQAAAHRGARPREPRDQRQGLSRTDDERLRPPDLLGHALVSHPVLGLGRRRPPAQPLERPAA